jgi:hypothetical protein
LAENFPRFVTIFEAQKLQKWPKMGQKWHFFHFFEKARRAKWPKIRGKLREICTFF